MPRRARSAGATSTNRCKTRFTPLTAAWPISDGRLFRGTGDGRIFALDAKTGKQLWQIKGGDPLVGEFFSSAPIAWKGLVFIGATGSDWGIRGFVIALDAATGKEKWRFYTIPMGNEPGADSWNIPETAKRGGGAIVDQLHPGPRCG